MKFAIITDQHFGVRGDSVVFHDMMDKFYSEFFFPYLKEHGIDLIVDTGDTFDRRKYVSFYTLSRARKYWFDPIRDNNMKLITLVGNHVIPYKNTLQMNALDLLLNDYDNVEVISEPTELTLGNMKTLMIPWICEDNYKQTMDLIETTKAQVAFGHLELGGFEMYKGAGAGSHDGMDSKIFQKFDFVGSGHFHHRSTKGNITYFGCPYEMTWSDFNDPKGFHIFDTETRLCTFIENPYRMFYKFIYDDSKGTLTDFTDIDYSPYKNTYVKVIVKNKNNPYWFDLFIDAMEKAGPANIQVVDDNLNLNLETDEDIVDEAEDTLTILRKYVDNLELDADKKKLDMLMRSLYEEAISIE
jgi:DNA repair exonuclease SbcCD nuclease subunit